MKNKKNTKKILEIVIVAVLVVVVIGFLTFCGITIKKDVDGTENKEPIKYTLNIKDSDFQYQVAEKLVNNGVIISDTTWTNWMDKNYPDFTYYNGEYYMDSSMSYEEIATKLQNPDISHKKVTVAIPEGYNVFDIAKTLEENGVCTAKDFYDAVSTTEGYDFEWLSQIPKNNDKVGFLLEGFLFPATYDLGENTPAKEVVNEMLKAFDDRYSDKMKSFCEEKNISLYDFITLCSIVQKEALSISSAGNIASALINRLEMGRKLECDVTYYYAKKLLDYGFSKDVYDSYYTYRCPALPSGPIANSGMEVINAVIEHPQTDYLFFFSDLKGEFHFASNGAEFEKLKAEFPWKK